MINIRPVSDLRNKYNEIEKLVLKDNQEVYLTKNGYGTMVVMSIDKYSELKEELAYKRYVEKALTEADKVAEDKTQRYYTHDELFSAVRRKINGEEI